MAGGAYDPEQDRWIPSRHPDFLFPIGVLSALVRGKFLAGLKRLYAHKLLKVDASGVHHLKKSATWGCFLDQLYYPRTMPVTEFVDLYAQHILPRGFHRVRFVGLWSGRHKKLLPAARLAVQRWRDANPERAPALPTRTPKPRPAEPCPACHKGALEHTDSVLFSADWRAFLWSGLPRGPPRQLLPRRRPT